MFMLFLLHVTNNSQFCFNELNAFILNRNGYSENFMRCVYDDITFIKLQHNNNYKINNSQEKLCNQILATSKAVKCLMNMI